jgi:hypothetical protein
VQADPLRQPAQGSRPHLDLDHRAHPHGEELPDGEVVGIATHDVEDHDPAYEDLEGKFLLQLRVTRHGRQRGAS